MKNPLVSIIITTYSRPLNLLRAVSSVKNQTYNNIELIVVDDNGEGTECQKETFNLLSENIKNGSIIYIPHEFNKNGSAARNTGLLHSKGSFVGFLDDDDVFFPEKVEKQVARLLSLSEKYAACYCNEIIYGAKREFQTHNKEEGNIMQELLVGKVRFNTSTILFRRSAILNLNGFDETFVRHQDWELMVRFFRFYDICLTAEHLVGKYSSDNLNKNPLRVIEYKEKFLKCFKEDIESASNPRLIYKKQYELLALSLLVNGCKSEGLRYVRKALNYGVPSFFVFGKYVYYILR